MYCQEHDKLPTGHLSGNLIGASNVYEASRLAGLIGSLPVIVESRTMP